MDLAYFYHRRGVALLMAEHASCDRSRGAHRGLAAGYSARIAARRDRHSPPPALQEPA